MLEENFRQKFLRLSNSLFVKLIPFFPLFLPLFLTKMVMMFDNDVLKQTGIPSGSTLVKVQVYIPSITHSRFNYVIMWIQKDNVTVILQRNSPTSNASVSATSLTYDDSGAASYSVDTNNVVQSGI
jgi:hypothetical protein